MPVVVDSRLPSIAAEATVRAAHVVSETCEDIRDRAKMNLAERGSVRTGALLASLDAHAEGFEGEVGSDLPYAAYPELGTGGRGQRYWFPGKPEGIDYSRGIEREATSAWRGIPKDEGFAYLIPALEAERPEFYLRCGEIYG